MFLGALIAPLSTSFSELFMMLVRKYREFRPLLHTKCFPLNRVRAYENCYNRSVVVNYDYLWLHPKLQCGGKHQGLPD